MNYNHMNDEWDAVALLAAVVVLVAIAIALVCIKYCNRRKRNRYLPKPDSKATRYQKPGSL